MTCSVAPGHSATRLQRWILANGSRCVFLALATLAAPAFSQDAATAIRLEDWTEQSHIEFRHVDGSSGRHYLVETVASGLASFDYDNDGDIDVYFLNGAALRGTNYEKQPTNELWRNLGQFQFASAAKQSRAGDSSFGLGICIGDVDNDGFADIYLSNIGANSLLLNNGDGTFSPVQTTALACGNWAGGGASMLDVDGDGNLDIYVANYIRFDYELPSSHFRGRTVYGGPLLFEKAPDYLLLNDGQGGFQDISESSGIRSAVEWGMGTICFDYDQDGDTDIFVANDSTPNSLFENDGTGKFNELALLAGVAYDHRGDPQGSMGIDVADFDADGQADIYQTAYTKQHATLYQNMGGGFFRDATLRTGAGAGTFLHVNWGTGFVDLDNDGDKDLFIANGHIHDNMDDLDDTVSYRIANQVLENLNGKRFADVSKQAGSGMSPVLSSRGAVIDDFDTDGRPDIIVLNSRERPSVLRNSSPTNDHWIEFDLVGSSSNRSAVGTRVEVETQYRTQILEVHSGRGYQSHFGSRLHFGLGQDAQVQRLVVHWHGSEPETFEALQADHLFLIRQGQAPLQCKNNQ
ncbi:MAG: CRTAC1 family protein [Planctomycetales bacterium]|nr:CRTAC1 family protein [Planctomycetales bacterium]